MELIAGLWLLYALHCVTWLPRGAVLFVRPLARWIAVPGPGWRLLHPLPSAGAVRTLRLPVVDRDDRIVARGDATWRESQRVAAGPWPVTPDDLEATRADDRLVTLGERPIAKMASDEEAERLAEALRALAPYEPGERLEPLEPVLARQYALARFEARRARVLKAARPLAWASDVHAVALLIALPALVLAVGEEAGLRLALPPLLATHAATLVALFVVHRRLRPGRRGERVEALLSSLVYPPGLLRAHAALVGEALGTFHPAVAAVALLPDDRRRRLLRVEIVRVREAALRGGSALGRWEQELLGLLLTAGDLSADDLVAPPERADAMAESYCIVCLTEYRRRQGTCSDCKAALVAYET